jgi:hypothetical protein
MKIRNGFVSNSSSSSFVVLCNEISFEEIKKTDDAGTIYVKWEDFGEGCDFFQLDSDMFDFLKEGDNYLNSDNTNESPSFFKVYWIFSDDSMESTNISKKQFMDIANKIPDNATVKMYILEVSMHATDGLETLRDRYFKNLPDPEKEYEEAKNRTEKQRLKLLDEEQKLKEAELKLKKKKGKK